MTIEQWAKESRAITERVYHTAIRIHRQVASGQIDLAEAKTNHEQMMAQARVEQKELNSRLNESLMV